ncbi:MAG: GNAT family N-acetyltransferase [Paenisporosarcina sp.]|nr:GNAT family N-acetyltransferase [Paenisporosarcina sp.]
MKHIFEGTIKKKNQVEHSYNVQTLTLDHLSDILFVQEQIISSLKDKEILQPLSKQEFQFILNGNGLMIGAFVDDTLIGFRALLIPQIDEEHLGLDIGLKEEELQQVIYQEISNVLPDYRGNQLQKTLAILIMQELSQQHHDYRYVCCTVATFNIPSLKDKFAQGMEILALKEKYGGLLRYIFVKDLQEVNSPIWNQVTFIQMDDIEAQQVKLAEGWRGFQIEDRDGVQWINFGHRK